MAITANPLTSGSSAVNASSYDTASIAPTANRLIRIAVINAGSNPIVTPTVAGCGLTWIQLTTQVFYSDGPRITYFYALTGPSPSSGPLTISVPSPGSTSCFWDVVEFINGDGVGVYNSDSCINCIGTGLTLTLAAFSNPTYCATDCIFAAYGGHHPPAPTVEVGFTEIYSSGIVETKQLITAWKSGEDNSILLFNSDGSENQSYAGIAVEILSNIKERYIKGTPSLEALKEHYIKGVPSLEALHERYVKGDPHLEALRERFIKGAAGLEALRERFIKGAPSLSFPERFLKGAAFFTYTSERFFKGLTLLSYPERFLKGIPLLSALRNFYIKGDADLQAETERYIKGIPGLRMLVESYIKGNVLFSFVERYIKGNATFTAKTERFIRGLVAFDLAVSGFGMRYIRGEAALYKNPPLQVLGDAPATTTGGLISRQYLNLNSVKKIV